MESTEQVPDVSRENKPIKEEKTKKKSTETGIIYLSRIPPLMNVKKIRDIFSEYGEIGRIFLQPDEKAKNSKKGRLFTEGWVEFQDKRIAKNVASALNNTNVGGKKKSRWHDELWNIKYLSRFKWGHLNERLAYEKAVHQQRMRTEISQVKREANFYIQNAEKNKRMQEIEKRKRKQGKEIDNKETASNKSFNIHLKDTEEEILQNKKRKHFDDQYFKDGNKKRKIGKKLKRKPKGLNSSFLKNLFSGGIENDSGGE